MKKQLKLALASAALAFLMLGGCAASHVKESERDTTGAYDGVWIASVGGPRASTALLPGNWTMHCDWEPIKFWLSVADGKVQFGNSKYMGFISGKGRFRIDIASGSARMIGGVMPGNAQSTQIYSGSLAGENPSGKYVQSLDGSSTTGCTGSVSFRRDTDSAS